MAGLKGKLRAESLKELELAEAVSERGKEKDPAAVGYSQWSTSEGNTFFPVRPTVPSLSPGVYDIGDTPNSGLFFQKFKVDLEGLIRFPDAASDQVIDEIRRFWKMADIYHSHNIMYKRGILLWGPPGSGKSCTIKLIMRDVIEMGGIVINFTNPTLFLMGTRALREIQPNTPVVVLMEDIDSIIETFNESSVLNFLDGVNSVDNIVFVATTNYPEKLSGRMINRPSRFDRRIKIGLPNRETRDMYLRHLAKNTDFPDVDRWVRDTEGLSLAHLKELFVATQILGNDYNEALGTLQEMKRQISSANYDDAKFGFEVD